MTQAFPELQVEDLEAVVRLHNPDTGAVVIDLMNPVQHPYRENFKNTMRLRNQGETYRFLLWKCRWCGNSPP